MAAGNLGNLIVQVGADLTGFAAGMSTVSGRLSAVDKEAQKAGAGFTKIGQSLTGIGMGISTAVTLPILGAGLAATKFASDFELGMRKVTSLIGGATQKEFADLSSATLKLAKDLGIDAVGATNALYEAISAGIPKENALEFVKVASVAAIAGLTDSKVAVNALTTVIAAYGLETTEAKELSDAMFQAVNIGKFQFADLAAEIGPAAQMSNALGVSYQELLAATATLSITTGSAGKAVTQVESAMRALLNPTTEMSAAFKKIEVASGSAAIKAFGFEGTLQKLRVATGGNVDAFTQLFGRIEGSQGALGLTGDKAAKAATDLDTMRHASDGLGAATVAYNEINKSTTRQLEITLNTLKATAIEMGTALLPAVNDLLKASKPLLEALTGLVHWFTQLPSGVQTAAIGVVALVAAVGPLVLIAGQASIAIGGIIKAAALAGPALSSLGALLGGGAGLAGILPVLVPVAIALGVAIAGWALYKAVTELQAVNKQLDLLYAAQSRGVTATKAQSSTITALESQIKSTNKTIGAHRVEIESIRAATLGAGGSIEDYIEALKKAAGPITQFGGATKTSKVGVAELTKALGGSKVALADTKDGTEDLKEETERLKKVNDGYTAGVKLLATEHQKYQTKLVELGLASRQAQKDFGIYADYLRTGVIPAQDLVNTGIFEIDDAYRKLRDGIIEEDRLFKDMTETMKGLAKAGTPVSESVQEILDAAAKADVVASGINKLGDAYKYFGITTSASLKQAAADARREYDNMASSGGATTYELAQGWVKVLEAERAASVANRKWTDEQEEAYQAAKTGLAAMEGDIQKVESAWKKMGDSIKDALKGLQSNLNTGLISALFGFDRREFNRGLDEQAADLQESLADQASEWSKYQVSASESLATLRSDAQKELDGGVADLAQSLQDAGIEWEDYAAKAASGLEEFRAKNAQDLEDDLSDLRDNLSEKTKAYREHVRDIDLAMGRTTEDSSDRIKEETVDTKRGIEDKKTAFARYQRDTLQKIAELTAKDAAKNEEQVRNLRESLADKAADLNLYISRANEDLADFTADAKVEEDRKLSDLRQSLADRTAEYDSYVSENLSQMDAATASYAAKLAKEEADVAASLAARKAEYDTYKADALSKFDALKTDIAAKLAGEEADLAASLAERKTEYDAYVADINAKMAKLKEDHRSIWDDIGSMMKGAFTDLGAEIARITLEVIEGQFIKALKGMLSGDGVIASLSSAFGGLGKTISGAFGGGDYGVTAVGDLPGSMPSSVGSAAGGVGSAAGGAATGSAGFAGQAAAAWIGAIGSAVSAVTGVIGVFQTMNTNDRLWQIEENTRRSMLYLGDRSDGGILGVLFRLLDQISFGYTAKATERIRDEMLLLGAGYINPSLDTLKATTWQIRDALLNNAAPSVSIVVQGNVLGNEDFLDSLAEALAGRLRLQGQLA